MSMSVVTGVETDARTEAKPPSLSGETCPQNTACPAGSKHSALRERHDLIRIDLRGHGGSDVGGPIGMEVWADDLAALLEGQADETRTALVRLEHAALALERAER